MVTSHVEGPAHAAALVEATRRKMKGKEKVVEDDPPPLMTSPVAHPKRDADGRFKCPYCDYKSKKASHHRSVRVGRVVEFAETRLFDDAGPTAYAVCFILVKLDATGRSWTEAIDLANEHFGLVENKKDMQRLRHTWWEKVDAGMPVDLPSFPAPGTTTPLPPPPADDDGICRVLLPSFDAGDGTVEDAQEDEGPPELVDSDDIVEDEELARFEDMMTRRSRATAGSSSFVVKRDFPFLFDPYVTVGRA